MDPLILELEESLRLAMLGSDVQTLDGLVSDRLMFVGPGGVTYGKQDDLELHRTGRQRLDQAVWEEVKAEVHGDVAVTVVTASLAGSSDGTAFSGRFKYIRVWQRSGDTWQVIGGSVTAIAP